MSLLSLRSSWGRLLTPRAFLVPRHLWFIDLFVPACAPRNKEGGCQKSQFQSKRGGGRPPFLGREDQVEFSLVLSLVVCVVCEPSSSLFPKMCNRAAAFACAHPNYVVREEDVPVCMFGDASVLTKDFVVSSLAFFSSSDSSCLVSFLAAADPPISICRRKKGR